MRERDYTLFDQSILKKTTSQNHKPEPFGNCNNHQRIKKMYTKKQRKKEKGAIDCICDVPFSKNTMVPRSLFSIIKPKHKDSL